MIYEREAVARRLLKELVEKGGKMTIEEFQHDIPEKEFKEILCFMMNERKQVRIDNGIVSCIRSEDKSEDATSKTSKKAVQKSFAIVNGSIYEEIYDKERGARFACWDGHEVSIVESIGDEILPIQDEGLELGAILLPKEPKDYDSIESLIAEVKSFIHDYLDVAGRFENIATFYILMSWIYDRFTTIPYLRALGDFGTGKSRFLDVIGGLCYKCCIVSGAVTPAPIYRMIKRWGGTIVFDESDFRNSTESGEIVKILNCGFEANKPVIRCLKDNPDTIQFLPTYSPKVFSSRRTFSDKALESRCLTEIMLETARTDIPSILLPAFYERRQQLINKLLMFRFQYYDKIDPDVVQSIDLGNIEKRLKQATLNFAVLINSIPELMKSFKQFLSEYNENLVEERYSTTEGMIIETIFKLRESGSEHMSSQDIAESMESEYRMKNPIQARSVGMYLKSLGIMTKQKRLDESNKRVIVWDDRLMQMLKIKYIPKVSDTVATDDTDATKQANLEGSM